MRTTLMIPMMIAIACSGCLGVDRMANGYYESYEPVRLYGSNGVGFLLDISWRATLWFSADKKVIRLSFPSGQSLEMNTPDLANLDPFKGRVLAHGHSQNFDVDYEREIVCDDDKRRLQQTYQVTLLKRGTDIAVGRFTGHGPVHKVGTCPDL